MKNIFFVILIITTSIYSFSQQINPSPSFVKEDYLKKSKNQKTWAWVLLGSGASLSLISFASTTTADIGNSLFFGDNKGLNKKTALFVIGGIIAASSIYLFIIASKNKKKAFRGTGFFKIEAIPKILNQSFAYKSYPALVFRTSL